MTNSTNKTPNVDEVEPARRDTQLISTLLEFTAEYRVEKILRLVVDKLPALVGAKEASLFWLDKEQNRVVLKETSGKNKKHVGKRRYALGEGLTGWVAKTGRSLRLKNIEDESELKAIDPELRWSDKYNGFKNASEEERAYLRAFLGVPIKVEGVTVGVLRIAKTLKPNTHFTERDKELLTTFARKLAQILKMAELIERAESYNSLIEPVAFTSPEVMHAYFKMAVNLIPAILNSHGCTIFLREEEGDSYVLRYASKKNPLEKELGLATYKKGEGLTGWILLHGKPLRINDIENDKELRKIDPALRWMGKHLEFMAHHSNFLAAPIKFHQEVYGVIRLSKKPKSIPFSDDDERLLCKYADILGQSIRALHLEQERERARERERDGRMLVKPCWQGRYAARKDYCFVLMPYSPSWSKNVRRTIKAAVEEQGLKFKIADEAVGRNVMEDVWQGICEARLVIADLSTANPNVAYEVGLADVLGRKIILLAQDPKRVPFDFVGSRLLVYDLNRLDELEDRLGARISKVLS
ncbi:MAG TPA: GAF domain-containing protein [Pyrinomonadaceae bacterium]|nr:GAF domain-containing protein [Pyrinomonadaceae bacterium]